MFTACPVKCAADGQLDKRQTEDDADKILVAHNCAALRQKFLRPQKRPWKDSSASRGRVELSTTIPFSNAAVDPDAEPHEPQRFFRFSVSMLLAILFGVFTAW